MAHFQPSFPALVAAWFLAAPAAALDSRAALVDRFDTSAVTASCGDGIVNFAGGERCDAGGGDSLCNAGCQVSACGDGVVNAAAGEACDPGFSPGSCTPNCQPVVCGDGVVNGAEECDDGPNNSDTEPGACRANCSLPTCGDGILDPGEDVDPAVSPSSVVTVDPATCRYDFSSIDQLYASEDCGVWDRVYDVGQGDADAFCKLITDNPSSTAQEFRVGTAKNEPGICCPPPIIDPSAAGCVFLRETSDRGVDVDVWIHDTDLRSSHGPGGVVEVLPENCTDPHVEE